MRGADENGQCYWTKKNVYPPNDQNVMSYKPEFKIETLEERLYYDDPVLSFEDELMTGCALRFTKDELINFCDGQGWKNLVIKQNLYNL